MDSELLQAKHLDDVVNDETSVTTALEALTALRGDETFAMIGDDNQLKSPVFAGGEENAFYQKMQYSPFARFRDLDMPAYLLTDQMAYASRVDAHVKHLHLLRGKASRWTRHSAHGDAQCPGLESKLREHVSKSASRARGTHLPSDAQRARRVYHRRKRHVGLQCLQCGGYS